MSSDSEVDEFYDAEDVTPARSDSSGIRRIKKEEEPTSPCVVPEEKKPSIDSANPQLPLNIEEEEKKLLREKAEAEERRKQEDADYKKKLEELQERRRVELLREKEKEEAAMKAQEAHDRMRRLEHMRGAMSGVKSPVHPATKSPHADGTTDEAASDEAAQQVVDEVCAEMCGFSLNTSTDLNSSHDFRHPSASSASSSSSRPPLDLPVSSVSQPVSEKNNLNNPSAVDEKLVSKNFPELLHGKAGDTPSSRSSPGRDSSSQESSTGGQEPDLIQSTKNKPPAEVPSPQQPVAPPRRRKKKKGPIPALSTPPIPEDQQASTPRPRGLPVTPTSPEVRVSLMVDNLEQSLDLHSATCGIRHVTAEEEEATRGEGQVESDTISVASTETMESGWSMEVNKDNIVSTERTKDKALSPHTGLEQKLQVHPRIIEAALENEKPQKNILKGRLILRKSSSLDRVKAESFKREKIIKSNSLSRDSKLAGEDEIPFKFQRPRSNSGRYLSDKEILDQVSVLNLDTGEKVPLSLAEERLPQGVNPLTLHIMRRTKEYSSDSSLHNQPEKKKAHGQNEETSQTLRTFKTKKKSTKLKKLFSKIKTKTDGRHEASSSDDDESADGRRMIKIKASNNHKGPYDFDLLVPVQDLSSHSAQSAAVWTMKFSHCGKLLATGGQDNALRVWVLKDAYAYFDDMRQKYSEATRVSPAPSQDSLNSVSSETSSLSSMGTHPNDDEDEHAPFMKKPFHVYRSHTADLLDLSWSKNYFILSSSMDKTVRLWHISRKECLCCFQHIDFVTAIAFHPRDDRYFLSGSLDGKLRLWNIPEKKVALWNEVNNKTLITAANFCRNGQFAVVGTYDGRCIFYYAEQLKYFTQIHVRSTRGKNARGRKVTGVEQVPGSDQILVTSNDSRIRLYDLRDLTLGCKYRGYANNSSQIKASFSSNGKYIISGSEDHFVYIWRTKHLSKTARKDRSDFWEGIRAHSAVVTAAIFAPNPGLIIKPQFEFMDADTKDEETTDVRGEVIVSADFGGAIKVFINKFKPGSG